MKMKKLMMLLLALCLCVGLMTVTASAASTVAEGECGSTSYWYYNEEAGQWMYSSASDVTWKVDSDGILTISGSSYMEDYESGAAPWYSQRTKITTVIIESGVKNIGKYAFYGLYKLTDVTIADTVTTIDYYAFQECTKLESIVIPDSVTKIYDKAFYKCAKLADVTLGSGVNQIGWNAFEECVALKNVYISNMGSWCLIDFDSTYANPLWNGGKLYLNGKLVTSVVVPDITAIGDYAFYGYTQLKSVTMNEGLSKIGYGTFSGCTGLTKVVIPESVTEICNSAFEGCTNLKSVTISEGISAIYDYTFKDCTALTNVTIPEGVSSIGPSAFYGCTSLTSITIPEGVSTIDGRAFQGCTGLTSVTIPEGVSTIDYYAFSGCTGLTSVTVQEGIATLGNGVFKDCTALTSVTLPEEGIATFEGGMFSGCTSLKTVNIPDCLTTIPGSMFFGCTALTSVEFPAGVTEIGDYAFDNCDSLKEIDIPAGVTTIGRDAFYDCDGLKTVDIPASVTSIDYGAFESCASLVSVVIPEGVTELSNTFYYCENLESVILPESIKTIDSWCFYGCDKLQSMNIPAGAENVKLGYMDSLYEVFVQGMDTVISVSNINTYVHCYEGSEAYSWCVENERKYCVRKPGETLGHTYENYVCTNCGDIRIAITTQPVTIKTNGVGTARFYVEAKGDDLTYRWQYRVSGGSWKTCTLDGATSRYLNVPITVSRSGNQYRCVITNGRGDTVYSKGAYLYVLGIKTQPKGQKVEEGQKAVFTVKATGHNKTYQWQYYTAEKGWQNCTANGNKRMSMYVPATAAKSGYKYRCIIKDSAGNEIMTKEVTLYVLGIKTQPKDTYVKAGNTAKITVKATGANKTYQWQYRTSASGAWKNCVGTGNKTATLKVNATCAKNGYQYRCVIKDSAGNEITTKVVNLYVLGIKVQPTNKTATAGSKIKLSFTATGGGLKYQWQYRTSENGSWKACTASGNKTRSLSISATAGKNGYQYRCRVTDASGKVIFTNIVTLTVK